MLPTFLLLHRFVTRRRNLRKTMKTAKNDIDTVDAECCRTCLATEGLVAIFNNKECEEKRSKDLRLVTGLEIKLNDGLSQKICHKCFEIMQSALQFRKTSRKSEKTLLNIIYGKKKKYKSKPTSCRSVKTAKNVMNVKSAKNVKSVRNVNSVKSVKTKKNVKTKDRLKFEDNNIIDYDDGIFGDGNFKNETDYNVEETATAEGTEQEAISTNRITRDGIPDAPFYKCSKCDREFRMKGTYKAHMRFHVNFCICETCGKRCRNNNQLQEHKRAKHGLGRIHKCAYCEYSSATKEALTIHERRHTGERPYTCDHCGTTFHRRANLVQHIAIHLPEKNFQCSICQKREKSHKRLQIHVFKRHKETRYRYLCPVCKESFAKPDSVRKHMVRLHHIPRERQGRLERAAE